MEVNIKYERNYLAKQALESLECDKKDDTEKLLNAVRAKRKYLEELEEHSKRPMYCRNCKYFKSEDAKNCEGHSESYYQAQHETDGKSEHYCFEEKDD